MIRERKIFCWTFIPLMLLCFSSCIRHKKDAVDMIHEKYSISDVAITDLTASRDSIPSIIDIEDLFISGNRLICKSELDTFAFHCFDIPNFKALSKYGKRGEGPGEFIEPGILETSSDDIYLIDNLKHRMINTGISDTITLPPTLVNSPKIIGDDVIGYYSLSNGCRNFYTYDIKKLMVLDSLNVTSFIESNPRSPFFWDANGGKVVIAFNTEDQILICDTNNGKIEKVIILKGELASGTPAFFDVVCIKDYFAVLTNRNKSDNGLQSGGEIIVYDYDGVPLQRYRMEFTGRRISYDPQRQNFIITGMNDDYIYIVSLNLPCQY